MEQPVDVQQQARAAVERLRPHPHRGDLIAAGAVPFTVALLLINVRLDDAWGTGIFFVLTGLAAALVLGMGVLAPMEPDSPRAYQVVLQLCGLALLFVFLIRLAQVLGTDDPIAGAGSAFWILTVVTAAAAWIVRERRSAVFALVGGLTGSLALLAFVEWAFDPSGLATTRWLLLLAALGLVAGALVLRDGRRRESVYLIDAAGGAILLLAMTWVAELLFALAPFVDDDLSSGPGGLWKAILLAAGLGLVAYAGVDGESGPGYLGALILLLFVLIAGMPGAGGSSLWFWPLVLLLAGGAMIGAGLRPREPLPPEPAPPGGPAGPARPVAGPFAGGGAPAAAGPAPGAPAPGAPAPGAPAPGAPAPGAPAPGAPAPGAPAPGASAPGAPAPGAPAPAAGAPRAPATSSSSLPATPREPAAPEPTAPESAGAKPEPEPAPDPHPTRPQPPVVPPDELPPVDPTAREHREAVPAPPPAPPQPRDPEPPASGSLWARADPGEHPTRQHRATAPDEAGDADAPRPPRDR